MKSVIYIDRTNLFYYGGNVHTPVSLPFQKETVLDMEIINQEILTEQIVSWIKTNKIDPSPTIILLSPTIQFQKEIPADTPLEQQTTIKKIFEENIPFNETYVKEITLAKSTLLIGINIEFLYTIRDIFHTCGFTVEAIVPIAEVYGAQPIAGFSVQVAQDALKKINKEASVPLEYGPDNSHSPEEDPIPTKPSSNRLFIFVGIFIILLGVLIIVYLLNRKPRKKAEVIKLPPVATAPIIPPMEASPSALVETSTSEAVLKIKKEDITINVLNGSGIVGQADTIRQRLKTIGYNQITTGNAGDIQSTKTLIVFKKNVAPRERNEIIEVLKPFTDQYTVQEKDDVETEVLIITSPQTATPTP